MSLSHLTAMLLLLAAAPAYPQDLEVTEFVPEGRTLLAGDTAVSRLTVRNRTRSPRTVWIGYSVQGPSGQWHDVPALEVVLTGRSRETVSLGWEVPMDAGGEYRVVMAAWSGRPGAEGAQRIEGRDQPAAFRVRREGEPEVLWRGAAHPLGRGSLRPEGVQTGGEGFRLHLPLASCDGAEVRTVDRLHYGEYTIRMQTPIAPGSLSAFFLYQDSPGDSSDEIDIEIHNDGSRRVLLTTWIAGKQAKSVSRRLPFDPSAGYHDYGIRWSREAVEFLVDGTSIARWTGDLPHSRMRLAANVWWPKWLDCTPLEDVRTLEIGSIMVSEEETEG